MNVVTLLLLSGLTFRVVWLWQQDIITEPARDVVHGWLDRHAEAGSPVAAWLFDLLTCPWCLSVWVAAVAYVWWAVHPGSFVPVAAVATASAVAGLASR
jgi:hypothetical protein